MITFLWKIKSCLWNLHQKKKKKIKRTKSITVELWTTCNSIQMLGPCASVHNYIYKCTCAYIYITAYVRVCKGNNKNLISFYYMEQFNPRCRDQHNISHHGALQPKNQTPSHGFQNSALYHCHFWLRYSQVPPIYRSIGVGMSWSW